MKGDKQEQHCATWGAHQFVAASCFLRCCDLSPPFPPFAPFAPAAAPAGAALGSLILEPSRSLSTPSITTCSPTLRPSVISVLSPSTAPTFTLRTETVESAFT